MKFSVAAVFSALAAVALAKPILTNSKYDVEEGVPFTLTWTNATGPVTITLMTGTDPNALKTVKDLTTGATGTSFTYTPSGIPSGTYAFRIKDSTPDPNYSASFQYTGTGSVSSATESSSTSASSTASGSSTTVASSGISSSTIVTSASTTGTTTTHSTTTAASTTTRAPTTTPNNNNEGQRFSSPIALVLITVAALVFFN